MDENIHTIQEGWPNHKLSVDQSIREYWPICDIINSQNGLLLCRERLIVPSSMLAQMGQNYEVVNTTSTRQISCSFV